MEVELKLTRPVNQLKTHVIFKKAPNLKATSGIMMDHVGVSPN